MADNGTADIKPPMMRHTVLKFRNLHQIGMVISGDKNTANHSTCPNISKPFIGDLSF